MTTPHTLFCNTSRESGDNQVNTRNPRGFQQDRHTGRFVVLRNVTPVTSQTRFQIRRGVLGKSSQTLTPQKCEPSVQIGVVMPARRWQGGPM